MSYDRNKKIDCACVCDILRHVKNDVKHDVKNVGRWGAPAVYGPIPGRSFSSLAVLGREPL